MILESNGEATVTASGFNCLGNDVPPQPQTTDELLGMWRNALRTGEAKMLYILVAVHPDPLSRERLGEMAGYTASGGTFGNYLGTLRRNGLAVVEGDIVRASATLFIDKES